MTGSIPEVDCAALADPEGLRTIAAEVGAACRDTGFFYAVNTPVPAALRTAVFAAGQAFFAAEPAVKTAVAITRSAHNRGYVGLNGEALDPARGTDNKEAFNMGFELPADDPEVQAGRPFRGVNLWPAVEGFRATLLAYYDAVLRFGCALHRAIAIDLGLPAGYFDPLLDRPMATLRLLHYPARSPDRPGMFGAGEHTDYGNITLLATDAVGGLQVRRRDGTWLDAPARQDAFVCNIGDCLMRWTNDVYVSTPHRVLNPAGRDRYSVAFFLDPNPDAVVTCLPTCHDPVAGERYLPVGAADYLRKRLDRTYASRTEPA